MYSPSPHPHVLQWMRLLTTWWQMRLFSEADTNSEAGTESKDESEDASLYSTTSLSEFEAEEGEDEEVVPQGPAEQYQTMIGDFYREIADDEIQHPSHHIPNSMHFNSHPWLPFQWTLRPKLTISILIIYVMRVVEAWTTIQDRPKLTLWISVLNCMDVYLSILTYWIWYRVI